VATGWIAGGALVSPLFSSLLSGGAVTSTISTAVTAVEAAVLELLDDSGDVERAVVVVVSANV
jgi:hypothetical protein